MRKLIALAVVVCFIVSLVGCSSPPAAGPGPSPSSAAAPPAPQMLKELSVEERVLFEQNDLRVTLNSIATDGLMGPALQILVENNGTKDLTVQTRNSSINGIMVDPMFSCSVAPGKKANEEILFMSSALKNAGIETILEVELSFHVFDSASWADSFDSEPLSIQTSAYGSVTQAYDTEGTVVLDEGGFKVIVKELDSEGSFWGTDIRLYIENNSRQNATIQLRDTSVNGLMVDPMFSCDVMAGKKAFDAITFMESELTKNGIETIDELEFSFHIFDSGSWSAILDSEVISLSFE